MIKNIIIAAVIMIFANGCKPEVRYIERVRIDTIKAVSPTIEETLKATIIIDTVIATNKIIDKDTIIDVRYYPITKNFYIKAKPDTVKIVDIDTLHTTQIVEKINDNKIEKIIILLLAISIIIIIIINRR